MEQTDSVTVHIDSVVKQELSSWYRENDTTLSRAVSVFLLSEYERMCKARADDAVHEFNEFMAEAKVRPQQSGPAAEPDLTDFDIADLVRATARTGGMPEDR